MNGKIQFRLSFQTQSRPAPVVPIQISYGFLGEKPIPGAQPVSSKVACVIVEVLETSVVDLSPVKTALSVVRTGDATGGRGHQLT